MAEVNTKKVVGRRSVRFESFDDLLADAERVAKADNVQQLGNWSPGQIFQHLSVSINGSIDGLGFTLNPPMRWMLTLLMKRKFLHKEIPAGFKATGKFVPEPTSTEQGLAAMRSAIDRLETEASRVMHPAFGNIGREEWDLFHLRHAEMHMSFLLVGQEQSAANESKEEAASC